jgi:hypothetical protein
LSQLASTCYFCEVGAGLFRHVVAVRTLVAAAIVNLQHITRIRKNHDKAEENEKTTTGTASTSGAKVHPCTPTCNTDHASTDTNSTNSNGEKQKRRNVG